MGGRAPVPEATPDVATAGPAAPEVGREPRRRRRRATVAALVFLAPALVILGAIVVYPTFYSAYRSLFDRAGDTFVGARNYAEIFSNRATLTAVKNNAIWVVVVPAVVTTLGLVFAVMLERIRWSTAFKVAVFMPMAISFLATGVIWRLVYEQDPDKGVANAAARSVTGLFREEGHYPGAKPSQPDLLKPEGKGFATDATFQPGDTVKLGLIAVSAQAVPADARQAADPQPVTGGISGVVWRDFRPGGGQPGGWGRRSSPRPSCSPTSGSGPGSPWS